MAKDSQDVSSHSELKWLVTIESAKGDDSVVLRLKIPHTTLQVVQGWYKRWGQTDRRTEQKHSGQLCGYSRRL